MRRLLSILILLTWVSVAEATDFKDWVNSLPVATTAAGTDVLYVLVDPSGTPISKKLSLNGLFTDVPYLILDNVSGDVYLRANSGTFESRNAGNTDYAPIIASVITATSNLEAGTQAATAGKLVLHNATNNYHFNLNPGVPSGGADISWTTPVAAPTANGALIQATTAGVLSYLNPVNSSIVGFNSSGVLGAYTSISMDNSAAQFYHTATPTSLIMIDPSTVTAGTQTTWRPLATGAAIFTNNTVGAGTYKFGLLEVAGTWTAVQTFTTSINPVAATTTLGTVDAEWGGLYLGDGKIIYGQADQSATLTSSASLWTANNFSVTTQFKLPSSDADPTATAGYMRHDSTNTASNSGGAIAWHDGAQIRTLVDTGTNYTIITKTEYIPVAYMEDGASAPTAAAVTASTRKVRTRDFRGATGDQDVEIHWMVPDDYVGGIKFRPIMFVTNATAPANTETIIFSLAGCSLGNSDVLGCTLGTAQTSTFTADATYVQYDRIAGPYSSEITVTDAAAGESAMLKLFRDQANDTYAQVIGLAGIEIRYKAKIIGFAGY